MIRSVVAAGLFTCLLAANAGAANILQDGTFTQPIGNGANLTPWSDWTGAEIRTYELPPELGAGNYASIPVGGDLFQRFSALSDGKYVLSFDYRNEAPWPAKVVTSIQQTLGSPIAQEFANGLAAELTLPALSGWLHATVNFKVAAPGYPINEFYFSNSYNAASHPIEDSINRPGTMIDVANVSLMAVPGPIAGTGPAAFFGVLLLVQRAMRRRRLPARSS